MAPDVLLTELRARGAVLSVRGDRIRVEAPPEVVTPELRAALVEHKPALLRLLSDTDRPGTPPPPAAFRFADSVMVFGDICAGWTPAGWAEELRRKASRCDSYRPDIAKHYRDWARDIEGRLGEQA